MSITTILNDHSFNDLKYYIRSYSPKKANFISNTGYPAFSTKIPIKFAGATTSTHEVAKVGEISDYAFCLEILRYVKRDKLRNFQNFFCHIDSAFNLIIQLDSEHGEFLKRCYNSLKTNCLRYMWNNNVELSEVVQYANLINKIENYHRVPCEYRDSFWNTLSDPCPQQVVEDVVKLIEIFRECFFDKGVIKENSTILLHPTLGTHTSPSGIADLFVDGILYDFKSTKRNGYKWQDVGQLYGYYILHRLHLKYDKDTSFAEPVSMNEIVGISLYYSRYGDIETCDLNDCNAILSETEVEFLAKMMDQHSRERYQIQLENVKGIFAESEWRKLASLRKKLEPVVYTSENIGYDVGDIVYLPSQGKGEVVKFVQKDEYWQVLVSFESGKMLWADINKTLLLNWKDLDNLNYPDCSHYFF